MIDDTCTLRVRPVTTYVAIGIEPAQFLSKYENRLYFASFLLSWYPSDRI